MEQTLGNRIAENRKRLKLTQDQLAEKLGVTAQAVSKWENDQSCPDITILPKLAEIFGSTTDALLGRIQTDVVHRAEVVDKDDSDSKSSWEFHWGNSRSNALGFSVAVICIGALYLLSQIFSWELSLWDILWPTSIFIFGLWGLFDSFSFFRIGCLLFGGYTIADKIYQFDFDVDGKLIWAALILIFGLSLLADALKKPKKPVFFIRKSGKKGQGGYYCENDSFTYSSSFGEYRQLVTMDELRQGDVDVSFGEYTIDLSEVESVGQDCSIYAKCCFGELRFLVPKRFRVISNQNTAFANLEVTGTPDEHPEGSIMLYGSVNFGEISIVYI